MSSKMDIVGETFEAIFDPTKSTRNKNPCCSPFFQDITLPKTNVRKEKPLKIGPKEAPKRKAISSSNHPFLGANCSVRVSRYPEGSTKAPDERDQSGWTCRRHQTTRGPNGCNDDGWADQVRSLVQPLGL